jgi:hypothetical protein
MRYLSWTPLGMIGMLQWVPWYVLLLERRSRLPQASGGLGESPLPDRGADAASRPPAVGTTRRVVRPFPVRPSAADDTVTRDDVTGVLGTS